MFKKRLEAYGRRGVEEKQSIFDRIPLLRLFSQRAEEEVRRRGLLSGVNSTLEQANIPLTAGEAVAGAFGLSVVAGILAAIFTRNPIVGGIVFVIAVLFVMAVLNFLGGREKRKFENQLPDTLTLISTSLRAGYSLLQAVEAVASEAPNPTAREFGRAIAEARLGRPVVGALEGITNRTQSQDFEWAVMAIEIQREVGGNLAEVLQTVAETMRQRNRLKGEIRALTAEGRISAFVLGILPFAMGWFLFATNPEYIGVLFTEHLWHRRPDRRRASDGGGRASGFARSSTSRCEVDMEAALLFPVIAVFAAAIALFVWIGNGVVRAQKATIDRLGVYGKDRRMREETLTKPLAERAIAPVVLGLGKILNRFTPIGYLNKIQRKLVLAGTPANLDAPSFVVIKVFATIVGLVLAFFAHRVAGSALPDGGLAPLSDRPRFLRPRRLAGPQDRRSPQGDAAGSPRRPRHDGDQRRGRSRLRLGPGSGGPDGSGAAVRGVLPDASGDSRWCHAGVKRCVMSPTAPTSMSSALSCSR